MIKQENVVINGRAFTKTYSDSGRYVVRDDIEYSEAIDPSEFNRTYTEGREIGTSEFDASEILDIITGEQE